MEQGRRSGFPSSSVPSVRIDKHAALQSSSCVTHDGDIPLERMMTDTVASGTVEVPLVQSFSCTAKSRDTVAAPRAIATGNNLRPESLLLGGFAGVAGTLDVIDAAPEAAGLQLTPGAATAAVIAVAAAVRVTQLGAARLVAGLGDSRTCCSVDRAPPALPDASLTHLVRAAAVPSFNRGSARGRAASVACGGLPASRLATSGRNRRLKYGGSGVRNQPPLIAALPDDSCPGHTQRGPIILGSPQVPSEAATTTAAGSSSKGTGRPLTPGANSLQPRYECVIVGGLVGGSSSDLVVTACPVGSLPDAATDRQQAVKSTAVVTPVGSNRKRFGSTAASRFSNTTPLKIRRSPAAADGTLRVPGASGLGSEMSDLVYQSDGPEIEDGEIPEAQQQDSPHRQPGRHRRSEQRFRGTRRDVAMQQSHQQAAGRQLVAVGNTDGADFADYLLAVKARAAECQSEHDGGASEAGSDVAVVADDGKSHADFAKRSCIEKCQRPNRRSQLFPSNGAGDLSSQPNVFTTTPANRRPSPLGRTGGGGNSGRRRWGCGGLSRQQAITSKGFWRSQARRQAGVVASKESKPDGPRQADLPSVLTNLKAARDRGEVTDTSYELLVALLTCSTTSLERLQSLVDAACPPADQEDRTWLQSPEGQLKHQRRQSSPCVTESTCDPDSASPGDICSEDASFDFDWAVDSESVTADSCENPWQSPSAINDDPTGGQSGWPGASSCHTIYSPHPWLSSSVHAARRRNAFDSDTMYEIEALRRDAAYRRQCLAGVPAIGTAGKCPAGSIWGAPVSPVAHSNATYMPAGEPARQLRPLRLSKAVLDPESGERRAEWLRDVNMPGFVHRFFQENAHLLQGANQDLAERVMAVITDHLQVLRSNKPDGEAPAAEETRTGVQAAVYDNVEDRQIHNIVLQNFDLGIPESIATVGCTCSGGTTPYATGCTGNCAAAQVYGYRHREKVDLYKRLARALDQRAAPHQRLFQTTNVGRRRGGSNGKSNREYWTKSRRPGGASAGSNNRRGGNGGGARQRMVVPVPLWMKGRVSKQMFGEGTDLFRGLPRTTLADVDPDVMP